MNDTTDSMHEQLEALYAEREWLSQELGCCDAESVVSMVRSLEAQLADMYHNYGSNAPVSDASTAQLLNYVTELSQHLDSMFTEKSVTFSVENDKPVIRATWKETLCQGDKQ
jgi:hypothetical protein